MKREIKFRGKRLDNGEWVYGGIYRDIKTRPIISQIGYNGIDSGFNNNHLVDPDTIVQFTGLTDKNGKDIYEGDILLRDRCMGHPCIVEFDNGGFKIHDRNVYSPLSAIIRFSHIIGNIHDNPELLNA